MKLRSLSRRWAARGTIAAVALVTLGAGLQAAATAAVYRSGAAGPADPYSPAYHHPYRHGVVPMRATEARMRAWAAQHPAATTAPSLLKYGGGVDGIGVTSKHEKVYLVFWGSQWGSQGTNGSGDLTLSGDPDGVAPYLQELFKGLGTGGELWSGVMTQYCDGVSTGATSCPAGNTHHVAYPTGGAFAGAWADEGSAAPAQATAAQLGSEAVKAATHFGNTTAAANRYAQYVVVSPTGANPDNYLNQGFCAWHDWNGDVGVSSPDGDIAFTNLPYLPDAGFSCGQDFVNPTGTLDGMSIVGGHEYAETITDQNPPGGWTDASGAENADKCAWITPGTSGGAANLTTAHGTFAMQSTWANDGAKCEFTHAIVPKQLLKNPGFETGVITPWSSTSGVLQKTSSSLPAHSGSWLARLDGRGGAHTDTLAQKVTIGTWTDASFSFWLRVQSNDPTSAASDTLKVEVLSSTGSVLKTLATYSNLTPNNSYAKHSFSMKAYIGKTISIKFIGKETLANHNTAFLVDDTGLYVS